MKGRPPSDNLDYWQFHKDSYAAIAAGTAGDGYADWSRSYSGGRTNEMSDHLPVWIELQTDYSDKYLERFIGVGEA